MRIWRVHAVAAAAALLAIACGFFASRFDAFAAQGRPSSIQTAGGGKGPAAAPDANDPANAKADLSPKPPVRPLAPEEQAKQFWLPAGYRMEPVLADPVIDSPGQVTFDGNGRMFVVELRGYVQTPEGIDTLAQTGRISAHEDRDGDGTFERHTVFVDNLMFPRFAMPFGANAVLTNETNNDEIWKYTDTDADGKADRKELFTTNFGRGGSMEAQPSNLFWAMDNWLYSTVNSFRIRWTPGGVIREATGPSASQWGATQDDHGKVWFQHGASGLPGYFQFPVHYGNFAHPDQFEPNLEIVWGAPILIGDVQAGLPGTRLPDGSVIYATAAAGNAIYRGHRLPRDLAGDYIYGETVSRSVRRLRPVISEGLTQLNNVYPRSEFIRSLDPLFRPVGVSNAPDGTLYIADMYRGVIEGAPWVKEGTYLREKIKQYQLDKILGHGRVWRLTHEGMGPDRTKPRMLNETPAQLVAHLSHPNGWWRDTAQQLLVLKQDRSVVPALQKIARASTNRLARFHALWTLEGLGSLDAALARAALKDSDAGMRIQAIRATESLYKAGDTSFAADWIAIAQADGDTNVVIQSMLTLQHLKVPGTADTVASVRAARKARGIEWVAGRILNPPAAAGSRGPTLTAEESSAVERGATAYAESCFACHGEDGRGAPTPGGSGLRAPALAGSPRVTGHREYVIRTLLHGLTGPLDGRKYAEVMPPMGAATASSDARLADIASFIRNSFGNSAPVVTEADVARVRKATAGRETMWTAEELARALPRPKIPDSTWRATASHNSASAAGAFDFTRWSSGEPQQAGMWFRIEMPEVLNLTELQFDSPVTAGRQGGPPTATAPRAYRVEVSTDGQTWSAPVAEGRGGGRTTTIAFAPVRAKFVRITQTAEGEGASPWSMERLRVYEAPGAAGVEK